MWGGFRVARRARVSRRVAAHKGDVVVIEAAHDGLPPPAGAATAPAPLDARSSGSLQIEDEVSGRRRKRPRAFYHVHPAVSARKGRESGRVLLEWPRGSATMTFDNAAAVDGAGAAALRHPEFGVSVAMSASWPASMHPALSTRIDLDGEPMRLVVLSFYYSPDLAAGSFSCDHALVCGVARARATRYFISTS
jgi:hypothetical protein